MLQGHQAEEPALAEGVDHRRRSLSFARHRESHPFVKRIQHAFEKLQEVSKNRRDRTSQHTENGSLTRILTSKKLASKKKVHAVNTHIKTTAKKIGRGCFEN
ncbi:hypothetical protein [Pseudomonas sp. NPDC087626]|jgi:predicted ATP-binding protein involved in virulence|uniref:hypothetical protein n=1 Tax=Pseudomonas sp. NPDC087626 TaxID=3364444 RepID=UPI00380588F6